MHDICTPPYIKLPSKSLYQQENTVVHVRGTSDARLSQGMLAVLAQGLTGADSAAVLALKPEELATVCVCMSVCALLCPLKAEGVIR